MALTVVVGSAKIVPPGHPPRILARAMGADAMTKPTDMPLGCRRVPGLGPGGPATPDEPVGMGAVGPGAGLDGEPGAMTDRGRFVTARGVLAMLAAVGLCFAAFPTDQALPLALIAVAAAVPVARLVRLAAAPPPLAPRVLVTTEGPILGEGATPTARRRPAPFRPRFRIRDVMGAVVAYALFLGAFGAVLGTALAAVLVGLIGLALALRAVGGMDRARAAALAGAAYPWVALGSLWLCWAVGWLALGRPPLPSLDDPKMIAAVRLNYALTAVLLLGSPMALLVDAGLAIVAAGLIAGRGGRGAGPAAAGVVLIPALSWGLAYAVLRADPGGILNWYMD